MLTIYGFLVGIIDSLQDRKYGYLGPVWIHYLIIVIWLIAHYLIWVSWWDSCYLKHKLTIS
jgi:hypothetical protein